MNRRHQWLFAALLIMTGCTGKQESAPRGAAKVVTLFIWSNYLPATMAEEFEKQTGIKIQVSNFSSNEELLAKLQAGATGYDVIVPSDYMVAVMIKLGLLRELTRASIPNWVHLDSQLMGHPYDPENKFSVPYGWTTTGLAINRQFYKGTVKGWKDLLDNPALNGKFSLLDDVREVMAAALKLNGKSLNTTVPQELEEAKQVLLKARKGVRSFTSEPKTSLLTGDVVMSHMYSSDALQAATSSGGKIEFVIPEEGATWAIDNLAIPKMAPHVEEAHRLIHFLLEQRVNAAVVQDRRVGPVVKGVVDLVSPDLRRNSALFPSPEARKKWEMIRDVGEATTRYDRIWTEIKAAY